MSADGTPDPTPRDTLAPIDRLARVINRVAFSDDTRFPETAMKQAARRGAIYTADDVLSSPEARAAVIAATPRDELLAALVADGTLTDEWAVRFEKPLSAPTMDGATHSTQTLAMPSRERAEQVLSSPAPIGATGKRIRRRLVTRWEPLP